MALNIKNVEVEQLAKDVSALSGESKTEAVRRALEERKSRLERQQNNQSRAARLRRYLDLELWPSIPADELGRRLSDKEVEEILGYGEHGI